MRRKAAYLALRADYFGRPLDEGVLLALLGADYDVDVYAPDGDLPTSGYPSTVRRFPLEYRRSWLQRHLRPSWARQYHLYLATADLPMAFAGALAALAGRPSVLVCDEVHLGGYRGLASTPYWRALTRWAMRRTDLTVITDEVRIPLQRELVGLSPEHPFVVYPCSFARPYDGPTRETARETLGIAESDFVISATGAFTAQSGAHWLLGNLRKLPSEYRILIQTGGPPEPVLDELLRGLERASYHPARLGWRESAALTRAADVGLSLYLSPLPQFQHMGLSSQKVCTYLWLGIPVVASRQPSFAFVEKYPCGALIDSADQLVPALESLRKDMGPYRLGALEADRGEARTPERLVALTAAFRRL